MFDSIKKFIGGTDMAELKDVIAVADQQKRLYEAISSNTPDFIYVIDHNYCFRFANEALLEMLGKTREQTIGKSLREVGYDPSLSEQYEREIDQVFNSRESAQGEAQFYHSKLGQRYYHYIFTPIINAEGDIEAVAGTTRDITERKKAEEALRKNEEKYRTLVENFPSGAVGLFDKELRYTAVGGELVSNVGVDPEDRIGKKVTEIYPPEIVEQVEPYFHAALKGEANSFEAELHNRHLFAHTLPVKNDKGKIFAGMLVVQDVTQRWQAQRDLRKSEEKYRTLFKKMDEGFCIIQVEFNDHQEPVNYRYLETNPAYQRHAGQNVPEGASAREVMPNLGEQTLQRNGQVALTGEPVNKEIYIEELDRWLDLSAFRIGEPEERKVAVLFKNITERKKVQEELKSLNDTLEDRVEERTQSLLSYQSQLRSLASQLSQTEEKERHRLATELHDNLGQMLAVNKMKIDLLQTEPLPEEAAAALEEIKQGMDEAISYTRDLMSDLKPPPSLDKEDVRAAIEWVAEKMKKHNLEVIVEDDGQPKRTSEEIQSTILQSVREVLFNVVKHARVNRAWVRMKSLDNGVHITIEDEGQGFESQTQTSSSVDDGGFGLFNIQERLDLLGGRMEVNSEPGKGTRVSLLAPLKHSTPTELPSESEVTYDLPKADDPDRKIKVMLVDDHEMMREGLKKIVSAEEDLIVVAEAPDGRQAIESAREASPDVIIMDIDMPEMNGIDATKNIMAVMPAVRVVGLSLHNHEDVVESMRSAGASAFLSKGEAFETLCATIRSEAKLSEE